MFCNKLKPILLTVLLFIFTVNCLIAQKTLRYEDFDKEFKEGLDLFNKEKFGAAQHLFQAVEEKYKDTPSDIKSEAEYLSALCAIELFNKDAEYLITSFIYNNPESSRIKSAFYNMGIFQYRKKKYSKAVEYLEKIDTYNLTNDEFAEYYFKLGYSYFMLENYDKAGKAFYEIKDADTKYTIPALYYYSHIAYLNKNYENALIGFLKLSNNEVFAPVVPYYITQIYYYQKKYDKVIEYAPQLLDSATTKRQPEIARIIGEAFYRTNNYKKAIPYLENYKEKSKQFTREDSYELGYTYYRNGNFDKAVKCFQESSNDDGIMGQNSNYHLADCYLKLNDKTKARYAFGSAAKMSSDLEIQEDALYNYAKLTYELSLSPFNEAIKAFNKYIELYPSSDRLDEVYTYLAKVFMTTKNYKDAIESFESIEKVTDDIEAAYQRVTYFRGLELFNDLKFQDAIINFDKSLNNSKYNASYKAQCLYWRGEAYYRLKRFDDALNSYNQFILSPGAFSTDEYKIAHYNIAYCYFKKKAYKDAITWYRKFTTDMGDTKTKIVGDAYVRIGDCYFISKDYQNAIDFYNKVVDVAVTDVDYALFQKGFSLGLLKDYNQKIIVLNELINDYPKSTYCDDALFELGKSYEVINENDMAITTYQKIIDDYPNSSYVNKALLQMGLVYYNTDRDEDALKIYKYLAERSPNSQESKDALFGIKKIYVDKNDVDSYIAYTKQLGDYAKVSDTEQDSLMYISAENLYMTGDCSLAADKLNSYIDKFPNGNFIINAQFYKADCSYKNKDYQSALAGYDYVLKKSKTKFTEYALLNSARINFELANYSQALQNYTDLEKVAEIKANQFEAKTGKMKSAYFMQSYSEAIKFAVQVLLYDKLPDETFRLAHYILAKSYEAQNDMVSAMDEYQLLSQDCKSKEGSEAYYRMIEIRFSKKEYEQTEKDIFAFVEKNTPYQYWLAKSFLLLSDIYMNKKDNFQAKHTLQSIIDNYNNTSDEIIPTAKSKLENILESEKAEQQLKETLEIQLKFDDNIDGKYDKLFKEDRDEKILIDTNQMLNDSIK